ncbi:MAG: cyclic pyranopterin monophosphate synthase MoaC [Flavobacteriaceae bacterium]|nr:cyclic pyranopterin monophosphate synthase MoaC [Flavobacteriaceae bacterium]
MKKQLSHISENGDIQMVDVTDKNSSARVATASGKVIFPAAVFAQLEAQGFVGKKGSIIQIAVIAGIQAVKKTAELIPLCHALPISKIDIQIVPEAPVFYIQCTVKCTEKTGVEMEALTGVSISALTVYDMCKALSHDIQITDIRLEQKTGGKNDFER